MARKAKNVYNETANIRKHDLKLKIGNLYVYKVDLYRKRDVTMILRYPIEKELGGLQRINNMTFYGRSRHIRPKAVPKTEKK